MTPATLGEIGNLGHEEKQAMREYTKTRIARPNPSAKETATHHVGDLEIAFLQGILWERKRWQKAADRDILQSEGM
jgi:hypothetical protein